MKLHVIINIYLIYDIAGFKLWNRPDCDHRIRGFEIHLTNEGKLVKKWLIINDKQEYFELTNFLLIPEVNPTPWCFGNHCSVPTRQRKCFTFVTKSVLVLLVRLILASNDHDHGQFTTRVMHLDQSD